jgi:hypothetical protein
LCLCGSVPVCLCAHVSIFFSRSCSQHDLPAQRHREAAASRCVFVCVSKPADCNHRLYSAARFVFTSPFLFIHQRSARPPPISRQPKRKSLLPFSEKRARTSCTRCRSLVCSLLLFLFSSPSLFFAAHSLSTLQKSKEERGASELSSTRALLEEAQREISVLQVQRQSSSDRIARLEAENAVLRQAA